MKTMQGFGSRIILSIVLFNLVLTLALTAGCKTSTVNLVGEWESQDSGNKYVMQVSFNEKEKKYEGILSKQGPLSQEVGFQLGELCWTAAPGDNSKIMKVQQKWRWGGGGVSTGFEWRPDAIELEKCSPDKLVMSSGRSFIRVKK